MTKIRKEMNNHNEKNRTSMSRSVSQQKYSIQRTEAPAIQPVLPRYQYITY